MINNINYIHTDEFNKYLINIDDFISFHNNKLSYLSDIKDIKTNTKQYKYLKLRKIIDFTIFKQANYNYIKNDKIIKKVPIILIFNMNKSNNKILSLYIRNLLEGKDKFYINLTYNKIRSEMGLFKYNIFYELISKIHNILNINFKQIITIFEGAIDSEFFKNSISLNDILKCENLLLEELFKIDNVKLRLFFDNDFAGNNFNYIAKKKFNNILIFDWINFLKNFNLKEDIKDLNGIVDKLGKDIYLKLGYYFKSDIKYTTIVYEEKFHKKMKSKY